MHPGIDLPPVFPRVKIELRAPLFTDVRAIQKQTYELREYIILWA